MLDGQVEIRTWKTHWLRLLSNMYMSFCKKFWKRNQ
jgi:hypothetical protein